VAFVSARPEARAIRVIPSVPVEPSSEPDAADVEARAYGRAHRAHFVDDAPARALAAWNDYLAVYPRGTFAPEARYNRALCLVRLGRFEAAARALRGFAHDSVDGYRREEAIRLLGWLEDRIRVGRSARGTEG
jgi:TolA-binding protein